MDRYFGWIWYRIDNMECIISCLFPEYSIAYFCHFSLSCFILLYRKNFFSWTNGFFLRKSWIILLFFDLVYPEAGSRRLTPKNSFLSVFAHSDRRKKLKRRQRWFNYSVYPMSNFVSFSNLLLFFASSFFASLFSGVCPLFFPSRLIQCNVKNF